MSDPTPTPNLAKTLQSIKQTLRAADEGLADLPRIARAEMRANRSGPMTPAASSSPAEAETTEDPSDPATSPGFAEFDDAIQNRIDTLTQAAAGHRSLPEAGDEGSEATIAPQALESPPNHGVTNVDDGQPLAGLKALRETTQRQKNMLEELRDAYDTLEAPDLTAGVGADAGGAIYRLAKLAQAGAENDIAVFGKAVATLDQVIALVEVGSEDEAKALFRTMGGLGKQFWRGTSRDPGSGPSNDTLPDDRS